MIRSAKISEIPDILRLTKACASHMIEHGIYQWNDQYPSQTAFENDIARDELFVLVLSGNIVGTIVLSTLMDEEYVPVTWLTPNENNIYVHRLAVHPDQQGKGHAQRLMDFAENRAKEMGVSSVRLDTFSQNKRNQRFYENRGYTKLGAIYFPKQSAHPFHCYELVL
ncbi:GNAT family N-acetyltransferase [Flavobacteriaceae bacterium TP-CH-4]|uniref:GNAT family N-acetyltransferase n=1 Tax=Pelagihabitans pacificus TaxID=2696054 RepID=A0A967AR83_9FLAO|nr:GNAT family N-acetyltransferase [Pelagihabitans pacificus]NHF58904.1 GNAT family N-acetyltransferase [Pelagihabitans pacificus]